MVHFVSLAYHYIILIYVQQLVLMIDWRSWTYFKHSVFHWYSDYILWIKCENLKEKNSFKKLNVTYYRGIYYCKWFRKQWKSNFMSHICFFHTHNKSYSPFIVSGNSFMISYIYDEWKNMTNSHLTDLYKNHQWLNVNLSMMYVSQYILYGM